ncbi:MAG: DUF4476 domain-containing protein [Sphingobacteriales bacterium]|nr:MAG: DUF4476 domain-containing protein [Sphingobacteriales bacterium]
MRPFFLFLLCSFISFGTFAQRSNRSTLHIRLSDGQPLIVTINDRDYKKVNTRITITDIPGRRQHIKAYRFRPYADGKGGKAALIYSGTIKISPGSVYDCIVDLKSRKLLVKDLGAGNDPAQPAYLPPPPPPVPDARNNVAIDHSADMNMDSRLLRLQQTITNTKEDSKKLVAAKNYVLKNGTSTTELKTIASWIMFDDNKMDLLKSSYNSIRDQQNFGNLKEVFTMEAAQKEFAQYAGQLK